MENPEAIEEQINDLRDAVVERAIKEEGRYMTYETSGWRWDSVYGITYGDPEADFCADVLPDDTVRVFAAGDIEAQARIPGAYALSRRVELDETERLALAQELRRYADYRADVLELDTSERAVELSNDPTYAYDEQTTAEALEQEQEQIRQFQHKQGLAATPYRELADQVEQTGRLDLTDDAVRRDVTEVIDNAGWRLDGDAQDAPPQSMRRVVEAVQAARQSMRVVEAVQAARQQPQHDQARSGPSPADRYHPQPGPSYGQDDPSRPRRIPTVRMP